jgi:hypothetical protein
MQSQLRYHLHEMSWFAQFAKWLADDVRWRLDQMSRNRKIALGTAILLLVFLLWWRGPRPGDLYSVEGEAKNYKVAKVLVVDSDAVHIRLYKNTFGERPSNVDPSTLSVGSLRDPDGFGMDHMPLSRSSFARWRPRYMTHTSVTDDELQAYKQWKQSHGSLY